MKKKKKRKGATKQSSAAAAYKRGEYLYYEKGDPDTALKYFIKAAKAGYTKAYGEIGIILHRENNEPDEAEEWFIAEEAGCLDAPQAHDYGMLLIEERGEIEKGKKYLKMAEEGGYLDEGFG